MGCIDWAGGCLTPDGYMGSNGGGGSGHGQYGGNGGNGGGSGQLGGTVGGISRGSSGRLDVRVVPADCWL